jgi:Protein of unknown function (DUF742)
MTRTGHGPQPPGGPGAWYDDEAGPLVRPYAMTGGRTRGNEHELNMITLVLTVAAPTDGALGWERDEILRRCRTPKSVAEIAAAVDLPMTVVKVLISDLMDRGYVVSRSPVLARHLQNASFLQVVLDGIEQL